MTGPQKFYWGCIGFIVLSKAALAGFYLVRRVTTDDFFVGFAGVYGILSTLVHAALLVLAVAVLSIEALKRRRERTAILARLALGMTAVIAIYLCADWVLRYSFRLNDPVG